MQRSLIRALINDASHMRVRVVWRSGMCFAHIIILLIKALCGRNISFSITLKLFKKEVLIIKEVNVRFARRRSLDQLLEPDTQH